MNQEWYYSVNGGREGPVSAAELKKLADAGTLKATDLVWKDGMTDWAPAKSVKGLFGSAASPAPAAAATPAAAPARTEEPARSRPRAESEDADRPAARSRRQDDDEDRPRRQDDDEDEDDRPRRRRDTDEDDDERPSGRMRRRDPDEDEEDERPVRRRDEDDEEEDEDRPRRKRRRVPEDAGSKKMTAGLLAILIGWTGAHRFYLGDMAGGLIRLLVLNLVCAGGIVGLIEGIIYLTKTDEEFYQTYIVEQKGWF